MVLVIEVQTTEGYNEPMNTRGWCSIPLFDDQKRLISGKWRVPIRVPPIRPNVQLPDQNAIAQVCGHLLLNFVFMLVLKMAILELS